MFPPGRCAEYRSQLMHRDEDRVIILFIAPEFLRFESNRMIGISIGRMKKGGLRSARKPPPKSTDPSSARSLDRLQVIDHESFLFSVDRGIVALVHQFTGARIEDALEAMFVAVIAHGEHHVGDRFRAILLLYGVHQFGH